MKNKRWLILIIVGILLLPVNYYFVPSASAAWWDTDWSYYKTIEVDNKIDDYQMKILIDYNDDKGGNVSCEGHCQADFDDIRFVYNNATELPYWIENITASTQATFWVNNSGNYSSFEMFYGNAGVGNNSDGDATFDFFDHFPGGSIDTDKWKGDTAYASVADSVLSYTASNVNKFMDSSSGHLYDTAIRTRAKWSVFGATKYSGFRYGIAGDADHIALYPTYESGAIDGYAHFKKAGSSSATQDLTLSSAQVTNYQIWEIRRLLTNVKVIRESTTELDYSDTDYIPVVSLNATVEAYTDGLIGYYDWILVRKFVTIEPSWSAFGSEQSPPWSNTAPTFSNPNPTNQTIEISLQPTINVTITDADGNQSTCDFYTSTDGSSWTHRQTNSSVLNQSIQYSYTQASGYSTKYYWKVTANDTHDNSSVIYEFTTLFDVSSWSYYKTIDIESDYIDGSLTNFPVLVNSTDIAMIAKCQSNGEDIRFLSTDNTTEFYYEIERWTDGGFDIWVNISEVIDNNNDYTFLMYYGNASASDNQNPNDVWNSNYVGVWHLNQLISSWTRDSNPIYHPDADDLGLTIAKNETDEGIHLWYSADKSAARDIYHAWSLSIDGTFSYDEKILDIGGSGDWDEYGGWAKSVLYDIETGRAVQVDGKYWMFYDGATPTGKRKIGIATTTDLNGTWTRDTINSPCLEEGATDDWDDEGIGQIGICTVKDGDTYKMLYTGDDGSGDRSIGLATSSNLIDWTKEGTNPVLSKVADTWEKGLESPSIWLSGSTYIVVYAGWTSGGLEQLGLATGSSLTSLTKRPYNPIASPKDAWEVDGISDCCLFRDTDKDYILYEGENGYYAIGRMWCDDITTVYNADIIDSTINDNYGTEYGTVNYGQSGKIGYAIDFPGSNDYFRVTDDTSIEPQLVTLEAWHYSDTLHNGGMMDKDLGVGYRLAHRDPGDNDYFYMFDNTAGFTVDTYTATTWTYAVTTYDGTTGLLYKNAGTPESLVSADAITYSTGDLYIGANSDLGYDFNGKLDELRISNIARNWSWINASFHTQNQTTGFMTLGSEQDKDITDPVQDGDATSNLTVTWNVTISDNSGSFNWTIECNGQINSSNLDSNGSKNIVLYDLSENITYTVFVNVTDTSSNWNNQTYTFVIGNISGDIYTYGGGYGMGMVMAFSMVFGMMFLMVGVLFVRRQRRGGG